MNEDYMNSTVLEISPIGIVTLNAEGQLLYANKEAEKILGVSKQDIALLFYNSPEWGISDFDGNPFPDENLPFAQALQRDTPVYNIELAIQQPNGKKVYLSTNAAPVHLGRSAQKGITVTLQDVSDRILMEKKLHASEKRYKNLFDNLMDEVHVWKILKDKEGALLNWELLDANAAALQNWGQSLEAVVGKSATEIFGQDAYRIFKPIVERIVETGTAYRWESYFPPTEQYLSMDSIPLGDYFISTGRDITAAKQHQQEVTEAKEEAERAKEVALQSELQLKNTHSIAKLSGWEFDVATGLFSFNDNFYEIFGASVSKIGGYTMTAEEYALRFVHPDDRAVVGGEIGKALQTEDPDFSAYLEHRMLYENGEVGHIGVKYFILKDAEGNTTKLYGANQDISERKKIEAELILAKEQAEANEARYGGLLANLETGVVVHARDTSIILCNARANELLGLSEAQIRGKVAIDPYWKFIDDERNPMPIEDYPVMRVLSSKTAMKNQTVGVCRSENDVVWLLVNGIPVTNPHGDIVEVIISFMDVTDRKLAEEELHAAKERAEESDQLKTSFLQNISHEIRTPLNAICGFAQLLGNQDNSEETLRNYISIIQNSSDQLLDIVSDVLAISSLETGQEIIKNKKVNVNTLLEELRSIFDTKTHSVSIRVSQSLPQAAAEIETDETKLRQIASNLIANALKFTPAGKIEFGCRVESDKLQFFVKDTGIGIHPEAQGRIFERFKQADESIAITYGGTGLGLAISKEYAALLGGSMWVDSKPGEGSTFYFTIAYQPVQPQETPTAKKESIKSTTETITLLVAEDQLLNFKVIEGLLRDMPVKLLHARDGQEALEIFKANPEINLVLMDVKMPNMPGDEAAKVIKSLHPEMPIIAQSGYALVQEKEKYADIFDAYLTKPINREALKTHILQYIEQRKDTLGS